MGSDVFPPAGHVGRECPDAQSRWIRMYVHMMFVQQNSARGEVLHQGKVMNLSSQHGPTGSARMLYKLGSCPVPDRKSTVAFHEMSHHVVYHRKQYPPVVPLLRSHYF